MDDKRNERQKINDAFRKQKQIQRQTDSFNKQREIAEKKAASEDAKQKMIDEQYNRELAKKIKLAAKSVDTGKFRSNRAIKLINNTKYRKSFQTSFNKKTKGFFKNGYKKQSTARFSELKFKAKMEGQESLNALKNALAHNLRILSLKRDANEWHDQKSNENLYYYNGEYYTHEELEPIRENILDDIIEDKKQEILDPHDIQNKKDVKRLSDARSNYRRKLLKLDPKDDTLKKLIIALETKGGRKLGLEHPQINRIARITSKHITKLVNCQDIPNGRKKQKKKLFDKYLEIRAEHQKAMSYSRKITRSDKSIISELNFKIPHANGTFEEISGKEYIDTFNQFLSSAFPCNKLVLTVYHGDESESLDYRTGDNIHAVIDHKNQKTGKYDWREQQIDFARKVQPELNDKYGLDFDIPERGYALSKKHICHCSQILQLAVYHHFQQNLFNKHGYALRFLEEHERQDFDYIVSCLQENLPISERRDSRASMFKKIEEDNKHKMIETSAKLDEKSSELQSIKSELKENKSKQVDLIFKKIEEWKSNNIIESKKRKLAKSIANDIAKLKKSHNKASEQIKKSCVDYEESEQVTNEFKISKHLDNYNDKLCIHNKESNKCHSCKPKASTNKRKKF